ncbi:MAG: hypothetical protein J7L77_10580 [Clostridiales bacterium]|nr:hypothetical protein [Clostridiales bacterium]
MINNIFENRKCMMIPIIFILISISNLGFCQEDYTNVENLQTQISEGGNAIIGEFFGFHLKSEINRENIYPDSDHSNLEEPSANVMATYSEFQSSDGLPEIIGEYELNSFQVAYDNGLTITNANITASGKMSITSNIMTQMLTIASENAGIMGTYEVQSNSSLIVHNFPGPLNSHIQYSFDGTYLTTITVIPGYTETDTWRKTVNYCSCESGFTQNDIDMAREAGHQDCINAPTSYGLYSQTDLTAEYQRGCDTCSNGGNPAVLLSNANIHIPEVNYESPLGIVKFWIDLEYLGNQNGDLIWKLSDYGQQ